jgi:hypothetical protein
MGVVFFVNAALADAPNLKALKTVAERALF